MTDRKKDSKDLKLKRENNERKDELGENANVEFANEFDKNCNNNQRNNNKDKQQ